MACWERAWSLLKWPSQMTPKTCSSWRINRPFNLTTQKVPSTWEPLQGTWVFTNPEDKKMCFPSWCGDSSEREDSLYPWRARLGHTDSHLHTWHSVDHLHSTAKRTWASMYLTAKTSSGKEPLHRRHFHQGAGDWGASRAVRGGGQESSYCVLTLRLGALGFNLPGDKEKPPRGNTEQSIWQC